MTPFSSAEICRRFPLRINVRLEVALAVQTPSRGKAMTSQHTPRRFEIDLEQAWPASGWSRLPVVVAVSGGADSVALLRGLVSLASSADSNLIVGHFDHRLRPDSNEDANFVRDLCHQLQVPCEVGTVNEDLSDISAGSIEEAARDARYKFLRVLARQVGARYIATAHTAHDQAETILHRIIRGTGVRGLAGIPASRELETGITLVRPLLQFGRSDIQRYLVELDQQIREDSSNTDERFTRNRIRHSLLPELRRHYNPHADESLCRIGVLAGEMSDYVESVASEQLARCVTFTEQDVSIDVSQLDDVPPLIIRTMLRQIWRQRNWLERDMTFERWHELAQLVHAGTENRRIITLPSGIRAECRNSRLTIQPKSQL
jgi:tRNA(Ile)-lysidine synthase